MTISSVPGVAISPKLNKSPFDFGTAHILGVGGCGMSALAWALHACGIRVSGTDQAASETTRKLAEAGVKIFIGHQPSNIGDAEVVIVSTAIRESNPELAEARRRGVRVLHRSEALALFLSSRISLLVSGTHGKTTTTAMTGLALEAANLDPWVFVGGSVPAFGGNTRVGGMEWAVAEADESDGTFERLPANHLVVTNVEEDHLDYWLDGDRMRAGYRRVIESVPADGVILSCLDDAGANHLRRMVGRRIRTYGTRAGQGDYSAGAIECGPTWSRFDFFAGRHSLGRVEVGVPGLHNVTNAVAALGFVEAFGGDPIAAGELLRTFHGVGRRFDIKGEVDGITVVDDYGHHPTEIVATLKAVRLLANEKGGRLVVMFQPHRYSRTRDFLAEFADSLTAADVLYLTDVYSAGEDPIPGATSEALAERIADLGNDVNLIPLRGDLAAIAEPSLCPGDVVLTLGAGDITRTGPELLSLLSDSRSTRGAAK